MCFSLKSFSCWSLYLFQFFLQSLNISFRTIENIPVNLHRIAFNADIINIVGLIKNNDGVLGELFKKIRRDLWIDQVQIVKHDNIGKFETLAGWVVWTLDFCAAVLTEILHGEDLVVIGPLEYLVQGFEILIVFA